MNWQSVLTGMLPEHLLLIGIVLLLVLEIALDKPRGALGVSLVIVGGATAAAAWLHFSGYAAAPFPGHFSGLGAGNYSNGDSWARRAAATLSGASIWG